MTDMPTKNFNVLRDQVLARPGAAERIAEERERLRALIGEHSEVTDPEQKTRLID